MNSGYSRADFRGLDPLFSSRRRPTDLEIDEIIERFIEGSLTSYEAEAASVRLGLVKKRVLPRLLHLVASPDPIRHQTAGQLLQRMHLVQAVEPLRAMLSDPQLDDEHKMVIVQALHSLGGIDPGEDPLTYLRDPVGMVRKAQHAFLDFLQDPLHLEATLVGAVEEHALAVTDPEVISTLAAIRDRRVLPFLMCLLHAPEDEIVLNAIAALEQLEEPKIIPLLRERATYDPSAIVRRAAADAADSISEVLTELPPSVLELPVAPPPLKRCLLSTIDGNGIQVLLIMRQTHGHPCTFLDVLFNDHEGIKGCFGGQMESAEAIEATMTESAEEMGVELVEVGIERARVELMAAYRATLEARRRLPLSFMGWQTWLVGEDSRAVGYFPLPELRTVELPRLLAKCDELFSLDEFSSWFFDSEELGQLKRKAWKVLRGRGGDLEQLISAGIQQLVTVPRCRLLRRRLERQAWLLAQLYEDEEVPKLALAAAAGLADESPGSLLQHPLLREMVLRSFVNSFDPED